MNDAELIALFWKREEEAITGIEAVYGARLRKIAHRLLGNREDTEECLNDTYFKLWNAIPPHRPNSLWAFCATICRRTAMDILDKRTAQQRSAQVIELSKEMEECIPDRSSVGHDEELAEQINAFLGKLDEEKRTLFLRRYWFGESAAEIAKRYGYSETKVRSILFRTRKKLKHYLGRKDGDE